MRHKITVLVVDDKAVIRQALRMRLDCEDIEVIATASDPSVAVNKLRARVPDVIVLDIQRPRMDGLRFLRELVSQHPIPVVVCSALTERDVALAARAMEYGAVAVVRKPRLGPEAECTASRVELRDAVRAAFAARPALGRRPAPPLEPSPKLTADAVLPPLGPPTAHPRGPAIIALGASTGGTEALREVLERLPADTPGVVVVQHLPEGFTAAFARRLDGLCQMRVKEAQNLDRVLPGQVLIAQGDRHLVVQRTGSSYLVQTRDGPAVTRHRPSVDVLFRSVARAAGSHATAVLLTGMGDDGARGMLELRQAGARTIAQDEATSVVFGMPAAAIALGGVERVLPLGAIAAALARAARRPEASLSCPLRSRW